MIMTYCQYSMADKYNTSKWRMANVVMSMANRKYNILQCQWRI